MGQGADRDGSALTPEAIFDHPAFAGLKSRAAAFVVLRPSTRDLLWANATAAAAWGPAVALRAVLFGPPGRGSIGAALAAVVPGRAPQMFRTGLPPGLAMRGSLILARAVTGPDGVPVVGFAVPGSGAEGSPPAAWLRGDGPDEDGPPAPAEAADPSRSVDPAPTAVGVDPDDEAEGAVLAHRGYLAVLRDRLMAATDGAATLRFLWRTDLRGALAEIDETVSARLDAPLRRGTDPFADVVAHFDPAAGERLREALSAQAPWSGLAIRLPVAGGAGIVPTLLSGTPIFGRDRAFAGFRGFGVAEFARLETVVRGAPRPEAGAVGPTDQDASATSPLPRDLPLRAVDRGSDPVTVPDGRQPIAQGSPTAAEPDPGRAAFANVVDLRSFHSARIQPAAIPEAEPPEPPPAAPDAESPDEPPGLPPRGDDTAFLALGAALRAQIGEDSQRPGSTGGGRQGGGSEGAPRPSAATMAPLLDRLPVPVLVLRNREPLFANPAAARALSFGSPAELLGSGPRLLLGDHASGLLLGTGSGGVATVAGEEVAVEWDGVAAALWILAPGPTQPSAPDPTESAHPADDDRTTDLVDRVDDAVALLDGEGRIRRLNERGRSWFDGAAAGEPFTMLLAPESRPAALRLLDEARARENGSGAPPRREVSVRTAEAGSVPMLLTLGRIGSSGLYATLRDLSALRRAERDGERSRGELERGTGRLADLLARVSHEVRTPLNAILGFAEVMMDERFGPLGSPRYREYLKDIHASGAQVVALVGDLLDLSRIEAGRIDLAFGALDVNKVVAEIVAEMQPDANRGRVIVRTSLASRISPVMADDRSTRQIVRNLLSNAVRFNEPGGQVIVSTAQDDRGAVLLRIRDTGVGMTEAEIAAALDPLHAVTPAHPADGNGLGLPLARALVGANGASLSIRSRPREGTLVEVAFPAIPAEEARRPA